MVELFWELRQQRMIREAEGEAHDAKRKAASVRSQVADLRSAFDKMLLINRALWEFLAERTGLTEEQLVEKVNEIDLRDGQLDGKLTKRVRECPSCHRTLYKGHRHCLYCGAEDPGADVFDIRTR
jgi:hypothetical protein